MKKINDKQRRMIEDNIQCVEIVINSYYSRYYSTIEKEELMSEGYSAICMASMAFDESRGYKFATYASRYIYLHIQKYVTSTLNVMSRNSVFDDSLTAAALSETSAFDSLTSEILIYDLLSIFVNKKYSEGCRRGILFIILMSRGYQVSEIAKKYQLRESQVRKSIENLRKKIKKDAVLSAAVRDAISYK